MNNNELPILRNEGILAYNFYTEALKSMVENLIEAELFSQPSEHAECCHEEDGCNASEEEQEKIFHYWGDIFDPFFNDLGKLGIFLHDAYYKTHKLDMKAIHNYQLLIGNSCEELHTKLENAHVTTDLGLYYRAMLHFGINMIPTMAIISVLNDVDETKDSSLAGTFSEMQSSSKHIN